MRHKPNRRTRTIKITNANTVGKKLMPLVQRNAQVSSSKYYDVVIQNTVGKLFLSPTASYQQGAGGRNWFPWCFSGCTGSFTWAFSKTVIIQCTLFLRFKKFKKWLWYVSKGKDQKYTSNWLGITRRGGTAPISDLLELIFLRKWWARRAWQATVHGLKKSQIWLSMQ